VAGRQIQSIDFGWQIFRLVDIDCLGAPSSTGGDKLGPCETVAPIGKGGMGARDAPPRARKSDDFGLADPNNSKRHEVESFLFRRAQARS
jgi:hypothetical protein